MRCSWMKRCRGRSGAPGQKASRGPGAVGRAGGPGGVPEVMLRASRSAPPTGDRWSGSDWLWARPSSSIIITDWRVSHRRREPREATRTRRNRRRSRDATPSVSLRRVSVEFSHISIGRPRLSHRSEDELQRNRRAPRFTRNLRLLMSHHDTGDALVDVKGLRGPTVASDKDRWE